VIITVGTVLVTIFPLGCVFAKGLFAFFADERLPTPLEVNTEEENEERWEVGVG
jgi:hypothetical protein